jgi:hypothetical protein
VIVNDVAGSVAGQHKGQHMAIWTKATLVSGQSIYLDLGKATGVKRVRGQGKDFTAVYCGGNTEPFEILDTPEVLLGIEPKVGAI